MIALVVSVQIVQGHREDFLAAIEANARASFEDEPGCLCFDVVCDQADDHHFFFYELYTDQDAVAAHRAAPHFATWREAADKYVVPGSQVNCLADQLFHHA
ncbi:MAG: putative quinol monooxygenase [Nocardioides sp.]|uniref:putative quinol monooxygenase n=1 Tax=Nocardioides sp. TaxID=35761 RepID=UPI0039E33C74